MCQTPNNTNKILNYKVYFQWKLTCVYKFYDHFKKFTGSIIQGHSGTETYSMTMQFI